MNGILEKPKIHEVDVFNICKQIGIPCKLEGYKYIKSAIIKIADNEDRFYSGVIALYKEIAYDFSVEWKRVERCIRSAIEKAFIYGGSEIINDVFGTAYSVDVGRPSNMEFLGNVYEYLKYQKERS